MSDIYNLTLNYSISGDNGFAEGTGAWFGLPWSSHRCPQHSCCALSSLHNPPAMFFDLKNPHWGESRPWRRVYSCSTASRQSRLCSTTRASLSVNITRLPHTPVSTKTFQPCSSTSKTPSLTSGACSSSWAPTGKSRTSSRQSRVTAHNLQRPSVGFL